MEQQCLYLRDTYLTSHMAHVLARDDAEGWVALDENIFHPQGGGQPADHGTVNGRTIHPRVHHGGLVILESDDQPVRASGEAMSCEVDRAHRMRLAALHTAGHLVDGVMSAMGFSLSRNNHFPGESRIEFDDIPGTDSVALTDELTGRIKDALTAQAGISDSDHYGERIVHIDGLHSAACGGTHVTNLGDLATVEIVSIRVKRGTLRVRYDATHQ